MKIFSLQIAHCDECPSLDINYEDDVCRPTGRKLPLQKSWDCFPDWCPLEDALRKSRSPEVE